MQKADHSGHRARMKKKLMEQGIDIFAPHEVLEILLFYAVPQRDTNNIAKNLIDHYGSLSAVLDASMESLKSAGLTEHQAMLLRMIPQVSRRYLLDKHENSDKMLDSARIPRFILDSFIGFEEQEHVFLMLLDKKGKVVYSGMIADGDFNGVNISVRTIATLAVNYSASAAVLAHNHPSGIAYPSREDVLMTHDIKEALRPLDVSLLDHYIVADHDCVSLAESGLFV